MTAKGEQQPPDRLLWELLTDHDATVGLEVAFAGGLRYVVGAGFSDPYGRPVPRAVAYPYLRDLWHAYDRGRSMPPEGDTPHNADTPHKGGTSASADTPPARHLGRSGTSPR